MNKILYLPIETMSRELDSRLLISSFFVAGGWTVVIGTKIEILKYMKYLPKGYFIYKDFAPHHGARVTSLLIDCGHKVFILDEESFVLPYDPMNYLNTRIDIKKIDLVEMFFLPNQKIFDLIKDFVNHNKLLITGNPRVNLTEFKYHDFYSDVVDLNRQTIKNSSYILVTTNFALANHLDGSHGQLRYFNDTRSESEINLNKKSMIRERKLLHIYSNELLIDLLISFPDQVFVVRPHPEENDLVYREISFKYSNLKVEYGDSIIPWILGSKLIIHSGSTSGVESVLLGKHTVYFNPVDVEAQEDYNLLFEFQYEVTSIEELREHIKSTLNYNSKPKIINEFNDFPSYNNFSSAELIFKSVDSGYSLSHKIRSDRFKTLFSGIKLGFSSALISTHKLIKSNNRTSHENYNKKNGQLDFVTVLSRLRKLLQIENRYESKIKVSRLLGNTYIARK